MGRQKNTAKGWEKAPSSHSPTPSSHVGVARDPRDAVQGLRDEVASLEEALSQMGTSSQMPFQFTQCGGSPLEWSLLLEHWAYPSANEDQMHYCVQIRVTLGEGRGDQPPPPHAQTGSLIADIFQEDLEERITKAVVLAPGEAILFFGRWSLKEGLPHRKTRDVAFSIAGPVTWGRRQAQVKMTVNMVQEGCQAIAEAVAEKRMKAQGPGSPWGKKRNNQALAAACNIEEWMQGIEEDDSKVKLRNGKVGNHGAEPRHVWSWNVSRGRRCSRRQGRPNFPQDTLGGSPSSGGGSSDQGSDQSSHSSALTWGSREGNRPVWAGRSPRVKVNLPMFKDEKTKHAVTHHSWQWDVAILHCLGWDDQHLLPYVFRLLQGFLGDLARSLGKDTTLTDLLWTLDEHFGMVMMFDALSNEFYSLKQTSGENVAEFWVHLSQQVQILQSEYVRRIQQEHVEKMKWDHFYEGLNPYFRHMLAHKVDGDHPASYSD